jgi:hypothetical protein
MRRFDPVIGEPVQRHVRDAIRHEEFIARWRPVFEAVEAATTPLALGLGALLVVAMGYSFVIAILSHGHAS